MNLFKLIQFISLRYIQHHLSKFIITILGISLGLSIFITTRALSDTIYNYVNNEIKGETLYEFSIKSKTGQISFADYQTIVKSKWIEKFSAKAVKSTKVYNYSTKMFEALKIVAFDFINFEPNTNNLPSIEQNEINSLFQFPYGGIVNNQSELVKNETVKLLIDNKEIHIKSLKIKNSNMNQQNILYCDLVTFYELFPNINYIQEINLSIYANKKSNILEILKKINPSYYLVDQLENSKSKNKYTESFSVNLIFLSNFALFIGFLISFQYFLYISMSKKRFYQQILALGITKKKLLIIIAIEVGLILAISYGAAVLLALLLGKFGLIIVKETLSTLYFPVSPQDLYIGNRTLFQAGVVILTAFLIIICEPFINIRREKSFFRTQIAQSQTITKLSVIALVGVLCSTVSIMSEQLFIYLTGSLFGGYINLFLYLLGVIMCAPLLVKLASVYLKKLKVPAITTGILSIDKFPLKSVITISGLSLAFSLYLSVSWFTTSFKTTLLDWLDYTNWADVYIFKQSNKVKFEDVIEPHLIESFTLHQDVESYDLISQYSFTFNGLESKAIASKKSLLNTPKRVKLKLNKPILNSYNELYISESFKQKHGVEIGDFITITGEKEAKRLQVIDIYYNYGPDIGSVLMTRELSSKLFNNIGIHGIGVLLNKSLKETRFFEDLEDLASQYDIDLSSNEGFKERAKDVFDQTFSIITLLAIISGVIALLSLINYIGITLIDRKNECLNLRRVGASHTFLSGFIFIQILMIVSFSIILSIIMAAGVLYVLLNIINKSIFGWTIYLKMNALHPLFLTSIAVVLSFFAFKLFYYVKRRGLEEIKVNYDF